MAAKYEYSDTTPSVKVSTSVRGDTWKAMTFTPQIGHKITSVKLVGYRGNTSPGTITVSIRATDGDGEPTGTDLAVGTFNGDNILIFTAGHPDPITDYWFETTFSAGYSLMAGTKYAIVIRALDDVALLYLSHSENDYANGNRCTSTSAGVTWGTRDSDYYFEDWGSLVYVFPSDAVARVSSIRHIFRSGFFRMQVGVGDLGFDIDIAESTVRKALDTAKEVEEAIAEAAPKEAAPLITPVPPVTETGLPGVTMPFTPRMPTAAEMAERAGMPEAEYEKIIQQGKVTKALEEFGPLAGPADLEKFKATYPELGIGADVPRIGTPEYTRWILGLAPLKPKPTTKKPWEFWKR